MAGFVPDASLTLTWCFEDEATPTTDALLRRLKEGDDAAVQAHWPIEVTNCLLMAVRRGRISREKAQRFIQDLISLPIKIDPESTLQASSRVFALAQQHAQTDCLRCRVSGCSDSRRYSSRHSMMICEKPPLRRASRYPKRTAASS